MPLTHSLSLPLPLSASVLACLSVGLCPSLFLCLYLCLCPCLPYPLSLCLPLPVSVTRPWTTLLAPCSCGANSAPRLICKRLSPPSIHVPRYLPLDYSPPPPPPPLHYCHSRYLSLLRPPTLRYLMPYPIQPYPIQPYPTTITVIGE